MPSATAPLLAVAAQWPQLQYHGLISELQHELVTGRIDAKQAWSRLCQERLRPDQPFELHRQLYAAIYDSWQSQLYGPAPVWVPQQQDILSTNAARFMAKLEGVCPDWRKQRTGDPTQDWPLLQQFSCQQPQQFWSAVLQELGIQFHTPPQKILEDDIRNPDEVRWMPGARLNIASCALNCPKVTDARSPAITWAAEGAPKQLQHVSWAELRQRCHHVATCMAANYQPGDAIAIAMPLTVDAVVIYLGIVLAGCVVVSIADSFAAEEVDTRLRIAGAKAIFTQDVILRGGKTLPLYNRIIRQGLPPAVVIPASPDSSSAVQLRHGDVWWQQFLQKPAGRSVRALPHIVAADSHSNILFSSGTTGEPKAIPWTHTTPLRPAVDGWSLQDIQLGDVVAWPTNLGWMMGPWLIYASLLNGATIALYQGSPLGRDFGEFIAAARVNVLGLVPSIVKAWRSSDCMQGLNWRSLKCFSSTGEASSPDDYHWLASRVQGYRPVIEYCGGTEIGGGFLSGCRVQPQAPSTFNTPTLGARLVLLGQDGQQYPHGAHAVPVVGELAIVPPMLGSSQQLLNRDHTATYYKDMPRCKVTGRLLRRHGDEMQRLPGGYYRALGRCDDTMNLGGIKVSSVELERVVMQNVPGALEVAAIGIPSPGGGPELLHLFVVPDKAPPGEQAAAAIKTLQHACQKAVREHLNPLFKVEKLLLVPALPRTASNKVMRRVLRDEVMQPRAKL